LLRVLFYGALGAAAAYFFDPDNGRRRRASTRERLPAVFRQGSRRVERLGRAASAEAYGAGQKIKHRKEAEKPQPDDVTLARKVESEIFRDADVPKGQINVNAQDGVVVLRGEVGQPQLISDLEEKTRQVQGVRDVENLLHVPEKAGGTKAKT
jgi:osmotically-inducible protein OsmY